MKFYDVFSDSNTKSPRWLFRSLAVFTILGKEKVSFQSKKSMASAKDKACCEYFPNRIHGYAVKGLGNINFMKITKICLSFRMIAITNNYVRLEQNIRYSCDIYIKSRNRKKKIQKVFCMENENGNLKKLLVGLNSVD